MIKIVKDLIDDGTLNLSCLVDNALTIETRVRL